jgi:hypothetical protein
MGAPKIVTAEDQLKLMRQGYKQTLEIKLGGLVVPCRIMPALDEATVIANAKTGLKVPNEEQRALFESLAVMKAVLSNGCTVDSTPYLSDGFLSKLSNDELSELYNQYQTVVRTVNPTFEQLTPDQLGEIIETVKKKERSSRDFFTWQLAEIGRYFLDEILPRVKEAGS